MPGSMLNHENFQLGVDFDDTLFLNAYPGVGWEVPNALATLERLQAEYKVEYLLLTLRTGESLAKALHRVMFDKYSEVRFAAVNDNPVQRMWEAVNDAGRAAKIHVDALVDDRAVGVPLMEFEGHDVVDWAKLEPTLQELLRGGER